MAKLQTICPICAANYQKQEADLAAGIKIPVKDRVHPAKPVDTRSEFIAGNYKFVTYSCGHVNQFDLAKELDKEQYAVESEDGKVLYPFQQETLKFIRNSNFRALLNLDMGLGKTPITCGMFRAFRKETLPAIIICKSSLKEQWRRMLMNWGGIEMIEVIENGKDTLNPDLFKIAIISFDLLRRMTIDDDVRKKYKTIIVDETQNIKSPETKRTQEVRALAKDIPNVIGLSGTPIKNNGTEYFTILNLLRSDLFRNYNSFCWNWVDSFWDGNRFKYGGIKRYDEFRERTKDFIIRFTRDEVLPDLPKINRQEQFCELGEQVTKAYKKEMDLFLDAYDSGEFDKPGSFMHILAYMSRMRHLTGIAKVNPCVDYLETFLLETDRKIVVFCHHINVMTMLAEKLEKIRIEKTVNPTTGEEEIVELFAKPMMYTSDMDSVKRDETIEEFKRGKSRILIASTLSLQEGVNLQPVSDCIMLERQWNPANEEQAEARFPRPGATADRIDATYFIAVGTIDEYFAELVERKRQICKQSLGDDTVAWEETSLVKELMNILATTGRRKWSL